MCRLLDYHFSIDTHGEEDAQTRDFDTELKALGDKARELKSRKVQQLGELVIATGADALTADELAGALIVLAETKEAGKSGGVGQARGRVLSRTVAAKCTDN